MVRPRIINAPKGKRWCGYHQKLHDISEFSGSERSCRRGKAERHRLRQYDLSPQKYQKLLRADGLCPICLKRKAYYIDHNHKTGEVRGFICPSCNTALGLLMEDVTIFNRAISYLTRNEKPEESTNAAE